MFVIVKVTFALVFGGATFIRWGRRDCEDTASGTTLVYSGKVLQITFVAQHTILFIKTKLFN